MSLFGTYTEEQFTSVVRFRLQLFRRVAYRILKKKEDADEAVQNALLKAWRRRLFLRDKAKLISWLCRIVVNESYNILRERQRMKAMRPDEQSALATQQYNEQEELLGRLDAAIESLPDIYRETIHVAVLGGIAQEEAAAILGCSINTLYQRIHKAKQLLREALKDE
ncbi:MAG: RNA polymerase sigma factor [Victivallales bacterium]|nr:RNA polymerase sigma factor [Victivallales bacterium]